MQKMRFIILLICVLAVSCSTNEKRVASVQNFKKDKQYEFKFESAPTLSPVLDKATKEGKLIFMDVSAEWCTPCQLMKRDVYTHKETAEFFNKNFINHLVDVEKEEGPDLKVIYQIKSYPTLLILDNKGRTLARHEGAYYHRDLIKFAQSVLDK